MHRVTLYKRELLLRSSHDTVHTKKSFSVARTQKQKVRFYSVFWGQFLEWARISYELFSVLSGAFGESTKYWVGPTDPAEARIGSSPSCGLQRFHVIRNPAL